MVEDSAPLIRLLGVPLYAYGLILALAALLAAALEAGCLKRLYPRDTPSAVSLALVVLPCAFVCSRLVYCLATLEMILSDLSLAIIPKTWYGGFTLVGAVLGGVLGVCLYARCTKRKAARLLDASVPAGALMLALGRLAEMTTAQGLGDYIFAETPLPFPLAVQNAYGDSQIPVFFYEALAALVLLTLALVRLGRRRDGSTALRALLLLCCTQVLLESLREDDFIRFGFVRFNQLCAVGAMLLPLGIWTRCRGRRFWLRLAGFLLCVGVCVGVEFALDKTELDILLLYLSMGGALTVSWFLIATAEPKEQNDITHS